jgi:hypothetical protein
VRQKAAEIIQNINQWITNRRESDFFVPAWFLSNHGSSERDIVSQTFQNGLVTHKNGLVQLLKFWTPFTLIFAKCHDLKQGFFQPFQVL